MLITDHINAAGGVTMLGTFAGIVVLMVMFLLYIRNRRSWWSSVSGMSCCDENCPPVSLRSVPPPSVPCSSARQPSTHELVKNSFDMVDTSSDSEICPTQLKEIQLLSSKDTAGPFFSPEQDLISLVEKGRVGISSNSSCCSSNTSSVGEKHEEIPSERGAAHVDDINLRTSSDIKETKIDSQGVEYKKFQTSPTLEDIEVKSNKHCIVLMNNDIEIMNNPPTTSISDHNLIQHHVESPTINYKYGHIEIALQYDAPMRKMTVHVLQARDLPSRDRGQPTNTQVRLILLPSKKQKFKTKIRTGENPQYMESFLLHRINPEDVNSMGLRFRLYGCERMRKERLIGEAIVSFANINLELDNNFWLNLEPRCNTSLNSTGCGDVMSLTRSDSTGSTHSLSMQHGGVPELLLGLSYNATTGRLRVEVVKGSHFRNFSVNKAPDTFVKLNLVSSTGQELAHSKTTVRRGQPNPLFKETFMFQVALFQLADVTLMISVYNRKRMAKKKEMVGWFSLGLNSSGAEELAHWMDMKEFQQQQILRWHVLVQS